MDWQDYFFGFQGRIGRAGYWLLLPITMAFAVLMAAVGYISNAVLELLGIYGSLSKMMIWGLVLLGGGLPMIAGNFAVTVKRLHDRGKSARWLLLFYGVPVVLSAVAAALPAVPSVRPVVIVVSDAIGLWALIELGFLRGTFGPNDYGAETVTLPRRRPMTEGEDGSVV